MDQVLRVLTLYDITAYLLPGLVVVWVFLRAAEFVQRSGPYSWSWKLVIVAYIIGQLLQVLMSDQRYWLSCEGPIHLRKLEQVFPDKPNADQTEFRKRLTEAINETFNEPPPVPKEWFRLCESYVRNKKIESFVEIMQARLGFFRGLLLSLIVAAVALLAAMGVQRFCWEGRRNSRREWIENILLVLVCLAGAWLSYKRTNDFDRYYAETTYRTFYVDHVLSKKHDIK